MQSASSAWAAQAEHQLAAAFKALNARQDWPDDAVQDLAHVMAQRDELTHAARQLAAEGVGSLVTRIHGDLHLGQVLVANGDVYIIDFEGEPAKPLDAAAGKEQPVAGRGGDAAVVRLCGGCGGPKKPREPRAFAGATAGSVPRQLRARGQPRRSSMVIVPQSVRRTGTPIAPCSICSCWRRPLTKSSMKRRTDRPGSMCPCGVLLISRTRCFARRLQRE